MDDQQIIKNMVGTAFNVLQEQGHPDIDKFGKLLRHTPDGKGDAFDLRYRRIDGKKLED